MSKEDNGGPAFPAEEIIVRSKIIDASQGMPLRDYFAARMMVYHLAQETTPHRKYNYMNAAIGAYEMADAMLEVRKK